jgi:hypothetical protein
MADDVNQKTGMVGAVASAASALAGTPLPYLLGIALMFVAIRWDGSLHPRQGCVQLQSVGGVAYKVDTCNVKAEPIRVEAANSAPVAQASASQPSIPASKQ